MELTSRRAQQLGRIGAHVLHSRYDSRDIAARARRGLEAKFEREADPDGVLSPEERRKRAYHLRQAHYARLSAMGAAARRKGAEQRRKKRQRDTE